MWGGKVPKLIVFKCQPHSRAALGASLWLSEMLGGRRGQGVRMEEATLAQFFPWG